MYLLYALLPFLSTALAVLEKNVLMTEVFEIIVDPPMFNWTYEGIADQYVYYPSLLDHPDLPSWIHYTYSSRHHAGFLFGVPPKTISNGKVSLEIICLNRKNYTTKRETIVVHINEKRNPARYEVHMKIDNLNVEDMFDVQTMDNMKNVIKNQLWKESQNDLYLTFLASAVDLGARKPLNPEEGEGVVLRLGSVAPLSAELIELQDEVRPLWKVPSCPRNFKRTSVERYFRDSGFALDWCSFRLSDGNEEGDSGRLPEPPSFLKDVRLEEVWRSYRKDEVPERSYKEEFLLSLLVPLLIMIILILLVSLILCFHHEGIKDEASEDFFENIFHICTDHWRSKQLNDVPQDEINQYATIHKATHTLRSLSNNRDLTAVSPECVLLSRSHTNSPTSTISRGVHCRPSPPPYVRPKFKPSL